MKRLHLDRSEWIVLAAILGIALALRLWGIFFGLPYVYHPDEGFEVHRAVRLGMGGFDWERVSKGGYYLLLFLEYGVYFVLERLTGAIDGVGDFAMSFVRDSSPFWKMGRVTTAILGTATVALVWLQGRRIAGMRTGLLAAWFLAVSFQHVVDSHTITVDVPMTLLTFFAVFLIAEDVAGRRRLPPVVFGLVAAYAIMTKIPAVLLFVPYFLGAWMRGGLRGSRGLLTRATLLPAALCIFFYVAANPGILVNIGAMLDLAAHTVGGATERSEEYGHVPLRTNLWKYYGNAVLRSQGPAMVVLALAGAVVALALRRKDVLLHASFAAVFFGMIAASSSSHLYYARYILPILPSFCLLAAFAFDHLLNRLPHPRAVSGSLGAAIALLIAIQPALASIRWDQRLTRLDTRTQAVQWIEQNVPGGNRILLEGFPEETAQLSIPLRNSPDNIQEMIDHLNSTDPGKAKFWELKLAAQSAPFYDLETIRHYEDWWTLEDARRRGIQWVVLRREYFVPGMIRSAKFDRSTVETRSTFYRDLASAKSARRMAAFEADPDGAPGFDLEIWRVDPVPASRSAPLSAASQTP